MKRLMFRVYRINSAEEVSLLTGLRFIVPQAVLALRHLRLDINLLMMVAVPGLVELGEYFEAANRFHRPLRRAIV